MPPLDDERCFAAASSRDARFDGSFVMAVRTTGIYCRPSCPALTPKRANVEFHHTAAAAQQRGFRACKRCLPDATPGSPEWNMRQDVVGRAMRLIADGVVERSGVPGLADRLGYSERHLNRVLTDEVGAGPLALARAQRAQTARTLIETTDLSITDIAFAAGFGSVRQFNDTVRAVFEATPTRLRALAATRRRSGSPATSGTEAAAGVDGAAIPVSIRLPMRAPFAGAEVFDFFGGRMIPGVEAMCIDDSAPTYHRSIALPGGPARLRLSLAPSADAVPTHVDATLLLSDMADLSTAVHRIRRMLDLDSDPVAIDEHLGRDSTLGPLVRAVPGRRSPGSLDAFETLVRAIVGQQISVAGARTVTGRIVEAVGRRLPDAFATDGVTMLFPTAQAVADAPDDAFSMPTARRDTIRRAAAAVACGDVWLDTGADPVEVRAKLMALKGIGPWTADYVMMRGASLPDVWLGTDLGVVHALRSLGVDAADAPGIAQGWAPWRSYAVHHLWAHLGGQTTTNSSSTTSTRSRT